jgi:mono/diheme cytochrome c family protein
VLSQGPVRTPCGRSRTGRRLPPHVKHVLIAYGLAVLAGSRVTQLSAEDTDNEKAVAENRLFESKIRPLLVQRCYKCHSASAGKSEGGLFLDSRQGIRKGGDRGPAVVPGKPDESLLLTAISHTDPDFRMPPKGERVSEDLLRDVTNWIRSGAPDPREQSGPVRPPVDIEAGRKFWSMRRPERHEMPATGNPSWPVSDLDRFVLAKLKAAGLSPSHDAAPSTLLRRLHFDLVGLPPSPDDVRRFLKRQAEVGIEAALEAEVDALLASPHFGERWGRHWLDVARFAESSGRQANITFPYAFRYRDYVIDSVGADVPFDRFLTEQLAGDLLPYDGKAERARLLIATGFLAVGPKDLDAANPIQFLADVIDEQIDSVTRGVMASSVACARCHDHKFDPYSMQDYYALAGIFGSTKTFFGTAVSPANRVGGDPLLLPDVEGQSILHKGIPAKRVTQLKADLAALEAEEKEGRAAVLRAIAEGRSPEGIFTLRDALRIFWRSGAIEGQLEKVSETGEALPLAMGVLEREQVIDVPLLERGEIGRPGEKIRRAFPEVVPITSTPPPKDQSGRLELARWLTHPGHPLTARVFVNRVWHHLLGAGIVKTVDNFGMTGELPSHPELLDHLAVEFVAKGWSTKKLIRQIVLSRTYRQASTFDAAAFQIDPDNRLLWRASKRRLDAEAIRDAMLVAAGDLDSTRPEGSIVARVIGDRPVSLIGLDRRVPSDLDGSRHRSVYLPVLRDRLPDVLDLFDFAEPSLVTGARETTNVPLQALYLMNSPFIHDRALSLAKRVGSKSQNAEDQVQHAFLLCFSRQPDSEELKLALGFLGQKNKTTNNNSEENSQILVSFCQSLLATAEFRNLD